MLLLFYRILSILITVDGNEKKDAYLNQLTSVPFPQHHFFYTTLHFPESLLRQTKLTTPDDHYPVRLLQSATPPLQIPDGFRCFVTDQDELNHEVYNFWHITQGPSRWSFAMLIKFSTNFQYLKAGNINIFRPTNVLYLLSWFWKLTEYYSLPSWFSRAFRSSSVASWLPCREALHSHDTPRSTSLLSPLLLLLANSSCPSLNWELTSPSTCSRI